jgi:hypothetical protein
MVGVRGPTWFVRVVSNLRPLLLAIEGFDGDIRIQDPRLA